MIEASKKALIIGSTGQDVTCLSRALVRQGIEVVGVTRHSLDLADSAQIVNLMSRHQPDQIYDLAAVHGSSEAVQSAPSEAETAALSLKVHVNGLLNFLQEIVNRRATTRIFYAASSRIFGVPTIPVQDESTAISPTETYRIIKAVGVQFFRMYRRQFGVHASTGILYNHESPMRSAGYVTQKIARAAAVLRPQLCGSPARLTAATGWRSSVPLSQIAARMVDGGCAT